MPKQTPSQTVGPYFAYGLVPNQYGYGYTDVAGSAMRDESTEGEAIRIEGRVFDGQGQTVPDAMIEIWQADAQGRYAGTEAAHGANAPFTGFGRCGTGVIPGNRFVFDTIKPGATEDGQAPYVNVVVFMRGMLTHAFTRIYFADDAAEHGDDSVLQAVPVERRDTLIAARTDTPTGPVYRFDIHMQGDNETVFFDV